MKLFILFVLMLTFSTVGFAQKQIESDYSVERNEEFRFSVFYPKDWTQLQPSHAQTRFKVTKEDGLYLTDFSVVVTYAEAAKSMSAKSFADGIIARPEIMEAMVKKGNPTAKIMSSGKTYISNRDAFYIKSDATYRVLDNSYEMTVYQIMTIDEGNSYTLTFRSPTDEFDDNFPIFKSMASSFVIRPTELKVTPKSKTTNKTRTKNRN